MQLLVFTFESISDITLEQLKLRPIIDQTGTYIYKASKVVAKYLGPLAKNEYTIRDTLSFPDLLKSVPSDDNYEDVSYHVESLFTSIPVQETIDYIVHKIYVKKELKPFCKKSIFKKLLNKLTTECVFSANNRLIKQIDGCPMGGPISVVLSDIYVCKMEEDIVAPSKPLFYKRYVDDTYVIRKKNETDELYNALNSYHQNIKLTLELNPTKFLDTKIIRSNGKITTQVYNKMKKLPVHWTSKIPVRYKRNAIIGELHRAKKIASNFDIEIKRIVKKYTAAGFPSRFVLSIIDNFDSDKDNLIIPQWLFEERKVFIIHLPFSPSNESFVKRFISKLNYFTNEKCKFNVVWNTRKVQSLFPLKDKVDHYSCVIYRGDCSCDQNYIGETDRNAKIRWNEHKYKSSKSEPAKHLKENLTHKFTWTIISKAPENFRKRRVLEAYFIKTICPTLN